MTSALKKSFDYSVVDKDTKGNLIWYATEIQKQGKTHIESGLEIGRLLSESREFLDGESFKAWVERECGCSIRSAYRFISAYENFGDCATVAHIELSAMYELAKNDCAKKAALRMAKDGKTVTQQIAKELVAKHSEQRNGKPAANGKSTSVAVAPVSSQPVSESDPFDVDPFEESARDSEPEEGGEDRSQTEVAPPADSKRGREKASASKLVDDLVKSHVGHIARGLTNIAEANGGEGEQFRAADAGLNLLINALGEMRKGHQ